MQEVTRAVSIAALLCLPLVCGAKYHRSHAAKAAFQREHPCPATGKTRGRCFGYVIDHRVALACGKTDAEKRQLDRPENMQWMAVADAKAKDRWERKECGGTRK